MPAFSRTAPTFAIPYRSSSRTAAARLGIRCSICRIGAKRSARHLSELLDRLEGKGVTLRILNFGGDAVDTRGATGRLMLNMFAAMAQFEREMMLERQREGIARAKAEGKYKGRKPTARAKSQDALRLFREGKKVAHIAKELGIGRGSVYRALADDTRA